MGMLAYGFTMLKGGGVLAPNGSPILLTLVVDSDSQISGSFTIGSTNQDGHYVYKSLSELSGYTLDQTLTGSDNTFVSTGLTAATLYYFKVVAFKGSKLSDYSNTANVETASYGVRALSSNDLSYSSSLLPGRVMPSVGYQNDNNYLACAVVCETNNSLWFRGSWDDVTSGNNYITGRIGSNTRRIYFATAARCTIQPNLTGSIINIDFTFRIENGVVYDFCILSKGLGVWELWINGYLAGSATSTDSSLTTENIFKNVGTGEAHYWAVYSRLLTESEMLSRMPPTTDLKKGYWLTGQGLYEYDISGNAANVTWSGDSGHYAYTLGDTNYYLNNGYELYQKAVQLDEYVAIAANPASIVSLGYSLTRTYAADLDGINMYPSKVRFAEVVYTTGVQTPMTGTANIGTAGAGVISVLLHDRRQRVRHDGKIKYVQFYYLDNTPANTDAIKIQLWRYTTSFAKLYELDITASCVNTGSGLKTINLPSWEALEGDFFAFEITNNAANNVLYAKDNSGTIYLAAQEASIYTYNNTVSSSFNWRTSGTAQTIMILIRAYAIAPQIACIGDSIMSGVAGTLSFVDKSTSTTFEPQLAIEGLLKAIDSDLSYQNLGVAGDHINEAEGINGVNGTLSRYRTQCLAAKPKLVIINGGINDIYDDTSNTSITNQVLNMVDRAISEGRFPVYLHVMPWTTGSDAHLQARDELIGLIDAEMVGRNGLAINLNSILGQFREGGDEGNLWDWKDGYSDDGVHPNITAKNAIDNEIYNAIIAAGYNVYKYDPLVYDALDRANTIVQTATSREASYYNQLQPFTYHILELADDSTMDSYFNTDYQNRLVVTKTESDGVVTSLVGFAILKL